MKQAIILSTMIALVSFAGAPAFAKGKKAATGTCSVTDATGKSSEEKGVTEADCAAKGGKFTASHKGAKKK